MAPEIFEALVVQLEATSGSHSPYALAQRLKAPSREVFLEWLAAVVAVGGMRASLEGRDASEIADAIAVDAQRLRLVDSSGAERLRERLARLLPLKSLAITSKAYDLLTEHEHPFGTARVLTDVRTIFEDSDEGTAPAAALIVHVLKLRDLNGQEYYTALSRSDLRDLHEVIQRAVRKEEQLRVELARTTVSCLDATD
jgi:hypothetical protein